MADYWKSLPRKFCEYCKCWITDNKPSVEFHERGKKHKENVQRKIAEIGKQGQKTHKENQHYLRAMMQIERAALKAFQKDLEDNPDLANTNDATTAATLASRPQPDLPPAPPQTSQKSQNKGSKGGKGSNRGGKSRNFRPRPDGEHSFYHESSAEASQDQQQPSIKSWFESVTEEGYPYFWNCETGESLWEPPPEGYVSIAEQNASKEQVNSEEQLSTEVANETQEKEEEDESTKISDIKEESEPSLTEPTSSAVKSEPILPPSFGPRPRQNPYGKWTSVPVASDIKHVDLQLPKVTDTFEIKVIVPSEEPKLKFKEKVFTSLGSRNSDASTSIGFKKRKIGNRNMRKKDDEEES